MIENQEQRDITQRWANKFEERIEAYQRYRAQGGDAYPLLTNARLNGMKAMLAELVVALADYDASVVSAPPRNSSSSGEPVPASLQPLP